MKQCYLRVWYKKDPEKLVEYKVSRCYVKDGFLYIFPEDEQAYDKSVYLAKPVADIVEYEVRDYS